MRLLLSAGLLAAAVAGASGEAVQVRASAAPASPQVALALGAPSANHPTRCAPLDPRPARRVVSPTRVLLARLWWCVTLSLSAALVFQAWAEASPQAVGSQLPLALCDCYVSHTSQTRCVWHPMRWL